MAEIPGEPAHHRFRRVVGGGHRGAGGRLRAAGTDDPRAFRKLMATPAFFRMLKDKTEILPQVAVATIVADNGDILNFSRSFPAPPINLAERDYFKAHAKGHAAGHFISTAVRNKGNGQWVFYISRRIDDSRGNMLGLVLIGTSVQAPDPHRGPYHQGGSRQHLSGQHPRDRSRDRGAGSRGEP